MTLIDPTIALGIFEATPVISTGIYAAGDLVGGKIALANAVRQAGGGGVIRSVVLTDLAKQAADTDVVFFSADPAATTFTDNAALDVDDADLLAVLGAAQLTTHLAFADNGVSIAHGLHIPFALAADITTLYAALVSRATPTYAAVADLTLRVGIEFV